MGVLVVHPEQAQAAGAVSVNTLRIRGNPILQVYTEPVGAGLARDDEGTFSTTIAPAAGHCTLHFTLGTTQKNQYAAPHICASRALRGSIAPTWQMMFSPGPTAGRKIRVYVLKAGAVYQK
ncbi:hypothetical protein [Pseudomonas sp. PB3P13]